VGWIFMTIGLTMASQVAPKMQIPMAMVDSNPSSIVGPSNQKSTRKLQVQCPFDFTDKRDESSSQIYGLERISRHPGLWSFGLVGLGLSALAPAVPQRIWWLGPVAVAWLGGSHTDSRFRRGMGGTLSPEYECQTSNVPFWATISGRQGGGSWEVMMGELKPLNAAGAVLISTLWVARRFR
jgi:hypothetical protein